MVAKQLKIFNMTHNTIFKTLLRTSQRAYSMNAQMMGFMPFPNDVVRQEVIPHHCSCSDFFQHDSRLISTNYPELQDAIIAASKLVHWRETYKGTNIGTYFTDRFGCFCIIGENAPFWSDALRLFMVYMPSGLYYPWHHHPAEESYMVVSGSATFKKNDCRDELLSEGEVSFHASNQSHAMETSKDPVLCLVAWRNNFQTPPILTLNTKFSIK